MAQSVDYGGAPGHGSVRLGNGGDATQQLRNPATQPPSNLATQLSSYQETQKPRNRHRLRAAVAAVAVAGAVLGPQAAHSVPVAHGATTPGAPAAAAKPKRQLCAWPRAAIGPQRFGNTGFIDTYAEYLLMTFGYLSGTSLRIHGEFPHARYMSYTVYSGRSNVLIDHLDDASIVPDRGSTNPFRPLANRNAVHRSYTIYIVQGSPPLSGRRPNTIYTGPYHPLLLLYRVYAPDRGADTNGSVPKPSVDVLNGPPSDYNKVIHLPACSTVRPARAAPNVNIAQPLRWQRFGSLGVSGVNADEVYLEMRLNRADAEEYVVRFKAPTFANTYVGNRITGREDVRFWSVCQYDMTSGRVVACLHDYQAVQSRSGYVTIVISSYANKPSTATRQNGVNWLPFGPEPIGILNYRQLLPNPRFAGSFVNVAPDAYQFELKRDLGRYMPTVETCTLAAYTPTTCSDSVDPQFCTDLIEPAQCGTDAVGSRESRVGSDLAARYSHGRARFGTTIP